MTARPEDNRGPADTEVSPQEEPKSTVEASASGTVEGERGIPALSRTRSVQSRVGSLLAVVVLGSLTAGLLVWYYSGAIGRADRLRKTQEAAQVRRAQGDANLPSLGNIHPPASAEPPHSSALGSLIGDAPPVPDLGASSMPTSAQASPSLPPGTVSKSPSELALERRLSGRLLGRTTEVNSQTATLASDLPPPARVSTADASLGAPTVAGTEGGSAASLGAMLHATATPAIAARQLPTQRLLLPQGAFIDCSLETAITSSLPGMTTCIAATDTFSADGSVVLLERGTKLTGETRGIVQQGAPRLFVLWTSARTPAGIEVPLDSPGTDELGRAGLSGAVDWHWWQRFGSALLVTVIDGVIQAQTQRTNSTLILNPSSGADRVATEALRANINIPPTISKPQGDRIQVFVARDVDFSAVYQLRVQPRGVQ